MLFYCRPVSFGINTEDQQNKEKRSLNRLYDCKGVIAVKYSAVKQNLQVQHKHVPAHKSYEERAPPPRRGTNRYKLAELFNPERYAIRPDQLPYVEILQQIVANFLSPNSEHYT